MYANKPEMAKRWERHTPKGKKLPERAGKGDEESSKKSAAANVLQSVGSGLVSIGQKFGGKSWVDRLNRLKERAAAGDESAQSLLSTLGLSSLLVGSGLGTVAGSALDHPMLGGALGAALGAAPSLAASSEEKKTPVVLPGFASETGLDSVDTPQEKVAEAMNPDRPDVSSDRRRQAFKYGFFLKVAELGLTPGEFTKRAVSAAPLAAVGAAGAAGKAGESAAGLGKWSLEKLLATLKFGLKTPMIVAPVAGALLGGTYRALTAPSYETPEDLRDIERIATYKRLAREALRRAKRKQLKRLELSGEQPDSEVAVPALAER
jgi:hypothetical protein